MANRFERGVDPRFVEDFIFQPNFALAEKVLQVNDEGLQNAVDNASLFGSIPVEYISKSPEAREKAQALISQYSQLGEDIINAIAKNPLDWRKQGFALNSLKNKLSRDFQTGELSKLRQSKENYDKTMSLLRAKDFDPTIAEAAERMLLNQYKPGTEGMDLFEEKTFLNRIDVLKEFTDFAKNIELDSQEVKKDLLSWMKEGDLKGVFGYIHHLEKKDATNAHKIREALHNFFQQPHLQEYFKQQQKLTDEFGNPLETYFNEKGFINPLMKDQKGNYFENPDIDESSLGAIMRTARSLETIKTATSDTFSNDSFQIEQWREERRRAERDNANELKRYGFLLTEAESGEDYQQKKTEWLNGVTYVDPSDGKTKTRQGLFEEIYKYPDVQREKFKNMTTEQILDEMKKTTENATSLSGKTKAERLAKINRAKNELMQLQFAGTEALAMQLIRESVVNGKPTISEADAINNAILMTQQMKELADEQAPFIPMRFDGAKGNSMSLIDFKNPNKMWEVGSTKTTKGKKIPREGTYGINKQTLKAEWIPVGTTEEDRFNKYYAITGATNEKDTAEFKGLAPGTSKDRVVSHGIRFSYYDNESSGNDKEKTKSTYGRGLSTFQNQAGDISTRVRHSDEATQYARTDWTKEIDATSASTQRSQQQTAVNNEKAVQNSTPRRVEASARRSGFKFDADLDYAVREQIETMMMRGIDPRTAMVNSSELSTETGSIGRPKRVSIDTYIKEKREGVIKAYKAWTKENNQFESPQTFEVFRKGITNHSPALNWILDYNYKEIEESPEGYSGQGFKSIDINNYTNQ